jgi:hypothetical protein
VSVDRDDWESSGDHLPEMITATVWDDGNVSLTMEMENGDVVHVGEHGGMSLDYLEDLYDELGDDMYEYLADVMYEDVYG